MIEKNLPDLPDTPGVYQFLSSHGTVLYIGKAKNLKSRVTSYFSKVVFGKTKKMVAEAKSLSYTKTLSDLEAILLEAQLVRKHQPFYNIQLKDDKSPIYIVITKDKFPQVLTARKSGSFGPYTNANTVRRVLKLIRRIYPFSQHKVGKKACLYSQMGLCNPCPNQIANNKKLKTQYLKNIKNIKKLLAGDLKSVRRDLERQMKDYAAKKQFEEAQNILKKITLFDYLTSSTTSISSYIDNPNFAQDQRARELVDLENILQAYLPIKTLKRIECFDISHLAGAKPAASMITFIDGESDKQFYRHFKIYQAKKADDYAALQEVIKRRLKHLPDWGVPDLIIVDGGKGQVSVALGVVKDQIPLVGLAKQFETLIIKTPDRFVSVRLPDGPAKNLVVRLRDEAHRFARRLHHIQVAKTLKNS